MNFTWREFSTKNYWENMDNFHSQIQVKYAYDFPLFFFFIFLEPDRKVHEAPLTKAQIRK